MTIRQWFLRFIWASLGVAIFMGVIFYYSQRQHQHVSNHENLSNKVLSLTFELQQLAHQQFNFPSERTIRQYYATQNKLNAEIHSGIQDSDFSMPEGALSLSDKSIIIFSRMVELNNSAEVDSEQVKRQKAALFSQLNTVLATLGSQAQSVHEVAKKQHDDMWLFFSLIMLAFIMAVLFQAFFILRGAQKRLIRPILHIAREIKSFDIDKPENVTTIEGNDEVASIGKAFNELAHSLSGTLISRDKFKNEVEMRVQSESDLREQVQQMDNLKHIIDRSPVVLFLWKNEEGWPVEYVSENIRSFGYSPDDFYSGQVRYTNLIHPDDLDRIEVEVKSYSEQEKDSFSQEYRLKTKDGDYKWTDDRTWIRRNERGLITHYQGIVIDCTARKTTEEAYQAVNKALKTISKVNEALIHASTEEQLLDDICRIIVEEGGFRMAWIGMAENDAEKSIRPVSHFGYEKGYIKNVNISWSDATDRGRGPTGVAIRTASPVITSDILNDENYKPWREQAIERGYQSSVSLPLLLEGEAMGALNIYASHPTAFNDDNTPLLMELARDLAYGLRTLQNKKILEKNEEILRWDIAVDTALADVSRIILQEDSLEETASLILDQVLTLTKSQFGFVGYIDPDTGFLVCPTFTRDIWDQCHVENKSAIFEKFTGLFGWVLNHKKPLLTNDPKRDPRSVGVPKGHLPIDKFLGVPALIGDELLGEIAIANPMTAYTKRDLFLLERIATFYALAIQKWRSNERIKESETQIRLLMNSTGEGIYAIDLNGHCTICNPAALSLLGYENKDDVIGTNMHDLIHHSRTDGSNYPHKECPICSTLTKGLAIQVDDEVFWKSDGSHFRVSYKANAIVEDNIITGAVVSFTDITERLETEQQIWQGQKVESIGNLAGGIAHDINNMLLPIQALTHMTLKDTPKDSRSFKRLEKVLEASEQAKNLVSRILTFSRKEDLKIEKINLAETIKSNMELLQATVPSTLTIRTHIENVGNVMADASQITAVLMNLVSNSADAMEGNVGNLTISLSKKKATKKDAILPLIETGRAYGVLKIKDDGHGIDANTLHRLFDPFFTTKGPGEGTGLGLSIVHGIITKHNGAVRINSKVGKGTTFDIFWPLVD